MLLSALRIALGILFLRGGPQDMPFDRGQRLVRETVLFTMACYTLFIAMAMRVLPAVILAGVTVGAQALATYTTVRSRQMANRYQQTLTALLLTNAILVFPMIPFGLTLQQPLADLSKVLETHPDWISQPDKLPSLPAGPVLAMVLLGFWQFVVSARVLGRAVDVGIAGGIVIALLCGMAVSLVVQLAGGLLQSPAF